MYKQIFGNIKLVGLMRDVSFLIVGPGTTTSSVRTMLQLEGLLVSIVTYDSLTFQLLNYFFR